MGCLSISEVRDYLANLLSAVQHVHLHNILHRDIKPANFLYHRATNRWVAATWWLQQCNPRLIHSDAFFSLAIYLMEWCNRVETDRSYSWNHLPMEWWGEVSSYKLLVSWHKILLRQHDAAALMLSWMSLGDVWLYLIWASKLLAWLPAPYIDEMDFI